MSGCMDSEWMGRKKERREEAREKEGRKKGRNYNIATRHLLLGLLLI